MTRSEDLTSTSTISAYIVQKAQEIGVSPQLALYVAKHESSFDPSEVGDLTITCWNRKSPYYGKPVYARGVFQFTRCWYWMYSDEMAFDPKFNIDHAIPLLADKKTCMSQFSTCRDYYRTYPLLLTIK